MAYIKRVKNTANQHFDLHDARLDDGAELSIVKDLAVNDTTSSKYVANRTHYINNRFEKIYTTWDGSFTSAQAPDTEQLNLNSTAMLFYKVSNTPITTITYKIKGLTELDEVTAEEAEDLIDQQSYTLSKVIEFPDFNSAASDVVYYMTIQNSDLEDIIVYYKDSHGDIYNNKTMTENFSGQTITIQSSTYLDSNNYVEQTNYGTTNDIFTIYNVTAPATVTIGDKELELTQGIYSIGKAALLEADIHPIKKPDNIVQLSIDFIPDYIIDTLDTISEEYVTQTDIDNAIATISIPDITNKMEKNSPVGYGDFYLYKNEYDFGGRAIISSDIYANFTEEFWIYENGDYVSKTKAQANELIASGNYTLTVIDTLPVTGDIDKVYKKQTSKKVATEDWANEHLMSINKTDFATLTVNNKRVLTLDDLGYFKGIYADSTYLPALGISVGDYAYVLSTYTVGGNASIKRYVYTNNGQTNEWVADQSNLAVSTFTPDQWRNINTDINTIMQAYVSRIVDLENRVTELEEQCGAMFEFAERQEF